MSSGFDRVARSYRWMEYLSFGPLLQRCRLHFLGSLANRRHALVLGDGDGRFCTALLRSAPLVTVDAVDSSPAMLQLLRSRCMRSGTLHRLRTHGIDAMATLPQTRPYDLVATHFFLDCFSVGQISGLVDRLIPGLLPGTTWIVSEFAIPSGALRWPATLLIHLLYRSFNVLTGLRTRTLPDYAPVLVNANFALRHRQTFLGGILVAELWQFNPPQASR